MPMAAPTCASPIAVPASPIRKRPKWYAGSIVATPARENRASGWDSAWSPPSPSCMAAGLNSPTAIRGWSRPLSCRQRRHRVRCRGRHRSGFRRVGDGWRRHRRRDAGAFEAETRHQRPVDLIGAVAGGCAHALHQIVRHDAADRMLDVDFVDLRLAGKHRDIEPVLRPAGYDFLVDHANLRADRHLVEQALDVFGIEVDAAVADVAADAERLVGAMQVVARPGQPQREIAHWI